MARRVLKSWSVFVALGLFVGACSGGGGGSEGGSEPSEIFIGLDYDVGTLDPAKITSAIDQQMTSNLYEGLLGYGYGGVELEPRLATEWESDEEGLNWTFHLREGVQFHQGYGELMASDVVFSLTRVLDEETASPNSAMLGLVSDVVAVGDYEVEIQLESADPAFLDKMAAIYTAIVSEKAVEELGDDFTHHPIGTGRFQFEEWVPGQETVLVANEEYWGEEPGLDRVTYRSIQDVTTRNNAFLAKELDLIVVTDPELYAEFENTDGVELHKAPGLITRFLGMKSDEPPFDDPRVREAVITAIDRDAMMDTIFKGISIPATGILSPDVKHAKTDILEYDYDPDRARELLAEAGYEDGLDVHLTTSTIERFTTPAAVIQQYLAEVGINMEITNLDGQTELAQLKSDEGLQMFSLSRGQDPTPDRVLGTWFHSDEIPANNFARIQDEEIDGWLDEALNTNDEDLREELFGKVQQQVADGNYYFFMDHEEFIFATHDHVKGFKADPQRRLRLDTVTIEK